MHLCIFLFDDSNSQNSFKKQNKAFVEDGKKAARQHLWSLYIVLRIWSQKSCHVTLLKGGKITQVQCVL